ncbi:MAG: hypothetical protein Q8O67_15880 [Deltaproteobacteria bacterium]|nr:hypothetical protein [Deltaproteobacteria bacterium]
MRSAVVVVALLVLAACKSGEGDARDLAVSSNSEARAAVDDALKGLAAGDVDGVLKRFCDQSPEGIARAQELVAPAIKRSDVGIRRIEAAWVGTEPFFYVEVADPSLSFVHGFGVRVRDGCLDRAVGATVLPRNRDKPGG